LRDGQLADRLLGLKEGLERDGGRPLAAKDQLRGRLVEARMQSVIEMGGLQEARDAIDRLVVDEDCAEQGLLGLEIMWRCSENRRFRLWSWENQCRAHEQP
jgi:hypothetical protein